jgi:hypothetical protein
MRAALVLALFLLAPLSTGAQAVPGTPDAPAAEDPPLRVVTLRGAEPGPTVSLVAGVHGGKRAAMLGLEQLIIRLRDRVQRGSVRIVPVAHGAALAGGLAQLSPLDSLNLNRVFPGRADGRPTERLAHRIMHEIVSDSDYLVDLHGSDGDEAVGAFAYAARPGLDLRTDSAALALARAWGTPRVVWDADGPRTLESSSFLQTAAHLSGIPAITVFETGHSREDSAATAAFVRGAERLLRALGMLRDAAGATLVDSAAAPGTTPGAAPLTDSLRAPSPPSPPTVHPRRLVTLSASAGTWFPAVAPGATLGAGELLGRFDDSSGAVVSEIRAEQGGVVLHVRLPGTVPARTPVVILAAGTGSPDTPQ